MGESVDIINQQDLRDSQVPHDSMRYMILKDLMENKFLSALQKNGLCFWIYTDSKDLHSCPTFRTELSLAMVDFLCEFPYHKHTK